MQAQPVEEDVAMAGEVADHGDQEGQKPTHFVPSEDSIKRTVVVKNLSFDVTADVLRERFADVGAEWMGVASSLVFASQPPNHDFWPALCTSVGPSRMCGFP